MAGNSIPSHLDDLLRDVAKDIVRGSNSNADLIPTNVLGWGDGQVLTRLDQHVRALSDRQYRVERVSDDEHGAHLRHVLGMSAYCARIDNRTNDKRYFGLGPYPAPNALEWA